VHRMIGCLCLLLVFCAPRRVSSQQPLPPPLPPRLNAPGPDDSPNIPPRIQKDIEKQANEQRQADLKRDTEKLLKLSTELKQYVDKSNQNILSVDVIKKADEIEKLAHSVKTKMRGNN
jgi:hypothetical protein